MFRRLSLKWFTVCCGLLLAAWVLSPESFAAGPEAASAWVLISVGGENRIAIYQCDGETGQLKPHGQVELPGAPGSLAVNEAGTRLYAAVRSKGSVSTLAIDRAAGRLELLDTTAVEGNPVYLKVDPSGRYLLSAYYGDGKAAVHRLNDRGAVAGEAVSAVTTQKNPHCILPLRDPPWVYVPNTGSDVIQCYRLQSRSGALEPGSPAETPTAAGAGPRHAVQHPSRPWLFVVNEKDSSVTSYSIDSENGALARLDKHSTLPGDFQGGNTCADIEITPCGRYLYASNRGHDSLAIFAVDQGTGRLKPLGHAATEKTPREFAIDPTGRFVYAAGQGSGKLAAYRIDGDTGKLQPLATYEVGKSPAWVLVLPRSE